MRLFPVWTTAQAQRCRLFRKPDFRPCEDAALNFTIPSRRGVPSSNRPRSFYNAGESPSEKGAPSTTETLEQGMNIGLAQTSDRTSCGTKAPATTKSSSSRLKHRNDFQHEAAPRRQKLSPFACPYETQRSTQTARSRRLFLMHIGLYLSSSSC